MSDSTNSESEQRKVQHHSAQSATHSHREVDASSPAEGDQFDLPSLLADASLGGHGNGVVKARAIHRAQQTHGNRAIQRSSQSTEGRPSLLSVQRGWFDDATGWVGDKASAAGSWASKEVSKEASNIAAHPLDALATAGAYVPIPGNPLQLGKAGHDINQIFGAGHNEQGDATPSLFEKGVNWMRDGSEKGANDLVAQTEGIPILSTLAKANAGVSKFTGDVTSGALKAVGGMVGGIGGMLEHPLDTAMGLEKMGENVGLPSYLNPLRLGHGIYDVASGNRGLGDAANHWLNPIEQQKQSQEFFGNMFMGQEGKDGKRHGGMIEGYRDDWNQGRYGSMLGRAGVDIGSLFLGVGEAGTAAKVGEAGTAVRAMGEAGTLARGAGELGTAVRGAGEISTGVRAAGDVGDIASGIRGAGDVGAEGGNVLRGGGGGGGALGDGAHAPGPTAYEPHPFEVDPNSPSGLKPVDPAPAQFPIPEKPTSGPGSGLDLKPEVEGLSDRGVRPQPGERAMTREEWQAQFSKERAEKTVAKADRPLENPNTNMAQEGHGHARHGSGTTDAEQARRVKTGLAPDGEMAPTNKASRFTSPEAEAEALGRAKRKLEADIAEGKVQQHIDPVTGEPTYIDPATGQPVRQPTSVSTNRQGGFGNQTIKEKNAAGQVVKDPVTGIPNTTVNPTPISTANVVWEWVKSLKDWSPVTYFPK